MNQEAKDDFFAKTTAIAECMSAWYQTILCYCLSNLSKLLKLPRPGRCCMPGPLKCNLYTKEFVKVPERETGRENQDRESGKKQKNLCKLLQSLSVCQTWYQAILCYYLPKLSKLLSLQRPRGFYMPGILWLSKERFHSDYLDTIFRAAGRLSMRGFAITV
jgi:hypothetical protein